MACAFDLDDDARDRRRLVVGGDNDANAGRGYRMHLTPPAPQHVGNSSLNNKFHDRR